MSQKIELHTSLDIPARLARNELFADYAAVHDREPPYRMPRCTSDCTICVCPFRARLAVPIEASGSGAAVTVRVHPKDRGKRTGGHLSRSSRETSTFRPSGACAPNYGCKGNTTCRSAVSVLPSTRRCINGSRGAIAISVLDALSERDRPQREAGSEARC